jgi:hypothetical protein
MIRRLYGAVALFLALICAITVSAEAFPASAQTTLSSSVNCQVLYGSGVASGKLGLCNTLVDANGIPIGSANPLPATDSNNAAFQGAVAMTVGTTYTPQRSIGANCTSSGNVSLTLVDNSTIVLPVVGYAGGAWQTFPFAVAAVNSSGTTATCAYYNLK